MLAIAMQPTRLPLEDYVERGAEAGIHWTAARRSMLQLFWDADCPLGAYEAADRLSRPGHKVHATSVYRCLSCFMTAGLVLPILSWRKFLISPDPAGGLWAALLCRGCGSCTLVELPGQPANLDGKLTLRGFLRRSCSAECEGLCRRCADARRPA